MVSRGSRADSDASGNYSFISTIKRGTKRNRNRFFTPKALDDFGPPEEEVPKDDWEVI